MRDWKSEMSGRGGSCWLVVEFERVEPSASCKLLIREMGLPGFVRATPEFLAHFPHLPHRDEADFYEEESVYWQLPFYTGRDYNGDSESVEVTDTVVRADYMGGAGGLMTVEFNPPKMKPGTITRAIAALARSSQLTVRHWKASAGWEGSTSFTVGGDQQALIQYLEMKPPSETLHVNYQP